MSLDAHVLSGGVKQSCGGKYLTTQKGGRDYGTLSTDVSENGCSCRYGGGEGNDGVAIYAPDGKMIGKINTPERVANLCFGGPKRNRLFMCGTTSLYSLYTEAEGATLG